MFCISCGKKLIDGARFCHYCGADNQMIWESEGKPAEEEEVELYEDDEEEEVEQYEDDEDEDYEEDDDEEYDDKECGEVECSKACGESNNNRRGAIPVVTMTVDFKKMDLDPCIHHSEYYHEPGYCYAKWADGMCVNKTWMMRDDWLYKADGTQKTKLPSIQIDTMLPPEMREKDDHPTYLDLLGFNSYGRWFLHSRKDDNKREDGQGYNAWSVICLYDQDGKGIWTSPTIEYIYGNDDDRYYYLNGYLSSREVYIYGDRICLTLREKYRDKLVTMDTKGTMSTIVYQAENDWERITNVSCTDSVIAFCVEEEDDYEKPYSPNPKTGYYLYDIRKKTRTHLNVVRDPEDGGLKTKIYMLFLEQDRMWTEMTESEREKYGNVWGWQAMVERNIGRPENARPINVIGNLTQPANEYHEQRSWTPPRHLVYFDGGDDMYFSEVCDFTRISRNGTSATLKDPSLHGHPDNKFIVADNMVIVDYDAFGYASLPRKFHDHYGCSSENTEARALSDGEGFFRPL